MKHTTKQATPLAPCQYDWTNSDIQGLHALASTLYGYVPPSLDVVDTLDGAVSHLVNDAAWEGDTATTFRNAWEKNSNDATYFTTLVTAVGDVIDHLAVQLAFIQNWWESQARVALTDYQAGNRTQAAQLKKSCGLQAQQQIKQAQQQATDELLKLEGSQLSPNLKKLLSDNSIAWADPKKFGGTTLADLKNGAAQADSLYADAHNITYPSKPKAGGPALDTQILNSHTVKDMVGFGGAGAGIGAIAGGTAGILGGPFAEITIPVGAGVGGTVGGFIGASFGFSYGLGKDLHFW